MTYPQQAIKVSALVAHCMTVEEAAVVSYQTISHAGTGKARMQLAKVVIASVLVQYVQKDCLKLSYVLKCTPDVTFVKLYTVQNIRFKNDFLTNCTSIYMSLS